MRRRRRQRGSLGMTVDFFAFSCLEKLWSLLFQVSFGGNGSPVGGSMLSRVAFGRL